MVVRSADALDEGIQVLDVTRDILVPTPADVGYCTSEMWEGSERSTTLWSVFLTEWLISVLEFLVKDAYQRGQIWQV